MIAFNELSKQELELRFRESLFAMKTCKSLIANLTGIIIALKSSKIKVSKNELERRFEEINELKEELKEIVSEVSFTRAVLRNSKRKNQKQNF
ncbi:MAG: hypothetical protein ACP5OG_02125 [Candidatus Nanoarchaeia archaeon]